MWERRWTDWTKKKKEKEKKKKKKVREVELGPPALIRIVIGREA